MCQYSSCKKRSYTVLIVIGQARETTLKAAKHGEPHLLFLCNSPSVNLIRNIFVLRTRELCDIESVKNRQFYNSVVLYYMYVPLVTGVWDGL